MSKQPIGIFDSGVGGTSIWKEIHKILPFEDTIYLADSQYAPYGEKHKDQILELCIKNTEYLLNQNCKLIVVACNTATTNAIKALRAKYNVPFIGIEPAIKPAALQTKSKAIGILATRGTLSSELFHQKTDLYNSSTTIIEQIGEGIVPLVESGEIYSDEMRTLLKSYLTPMIKAHIDYLVLGCTHYPYLVPVLKQILPKHITIIDSGLAVAKQTRAVLKQKNLLNNTQKSAVCKFYTNSKSTALKQLLNHNYPVAYLDF